MITIKEVDHPSNLASDMFFERTERIRSKVSACSREELMDLVTHLINELEGIQGQAEQVSNRLETILGYHDPLVLKR